MLVTKASGRLGCQRNKDKEDTPLRTPDPSLDLYRQVRAHFILQGTTLKAWCRDNDTHLSNARNCLVGSWNGPRGRAMRARIVKACGLKKTA